MSNNCEDRLYTVQEIKEALSATAAIKLDITIGQFVDWEECFLDTLTENHRDEHIAELKRRVNR